MERFKQWFTRLSIKAKWLLIGATIMVPLTAIGSLSPSGPTEAPAAPDTTTTKTETKVEAIPCERKTVKDADLAKGTTEIRQACVDGKKTITYVVTYLNNIETGREITSEEVTKKAVAEIKTQGTYVAPEPASEPVSNCDSNYSGACVPIASDVDCFGGSGNGPAYVSGPVTVVGYDIYDLDSDNDSIGCE